MGELLPYYALFYVLGLLLMALFVRFYWSRKKHDDAEKLFKKKRQEILDVAGPWKLSGHWWKDSHWCREEWDISLFKKKSRKRVIYKIYYDCQRSQWYIEGLYD